MLDLQVNGFAGVDFNDATLTPDAFDHALEAMAETGVTHCLPTLITADEAMLSARLAALDRAVRQSRLGRRMVVGLHLEGPFLNPQPGYAGCHPAAAMMAPDPALLDRLLAPLATKVRLLTLAPDQPGAPALIAHARARGLAVGLGHHGGGEAVVAAAVAAGARLATHLGNAVPRTIDKFDNPILAQLAEPLLFVSLIADGFHLPPTVLGVFARAAGLARCVLVTDATAAAAAAPGLHPFAGSPVWRDQAGRVTRPEGGRLAGSALTLDRAVGTVINRGIATAAEAQAMVWANAWAALDLPCPAIPSPLIAKTAVARR